MNKRMLSLAAGLLASLALAMPSHAGSIITTGTAGDESGFTVSGGTATNVEIFYSLGAGGSINNLVTTASGGMAGATVTTTPLGGGDWELAFTNFAAGAVSSGNFTVAFTTQNDPSFVGSTINVSLSGLTTGISGKSIHADYVVSSAVPEPSSIALLGIGLSGFIAFRRRFSKKLPVS